MTHPLSENIVTEIELLHVKATALIDDDTEPDIAALISHVPALCQSLRAAWADIGKFSTLADERHDLLSEERRFNDELRAERAGLWKLTEDAEKINTALREQLAECEQKRNELQVVIDQLQASL